MGRGARAREREPRLPRPDDRQESQAPRLYLGKPREPDRDHGDVRVEIGVIEFDLGPYRIRADAEATRASYAKIERAGPERCICDYCANWVAARERHRDLEFLAL